MTLIIALKCKNGTVIASDGRIVVGDIFRTDQKIYQISKGVLVGLAGSVGVIKRVVKALTGLGITNLDDEREIQRIEETLAGVYAYHRRIYENNYDSRKDFDERFNGVLLAVDKDNIYKFFYDGYPEPCGNYEAIGSASGYVLTLLQEFYDEDIDIEKGLELCVYCIYQAMKVSRDIGEPIQLGVATEEGARILEEEEVNKLVESVHRKEKLLRNIWGIISRDLKAQDELEKWVQEKLTALTKSNSVQESQQKA